MDSHMTPYVLETGNDKEPMLLYLIAECLPCNVAICVFLRVNAYLSTIYRARTCPICMQWAEKCKLETVTKKVASDEIKLLDYSSEGNPVTTRRYPRRMPRPTYFTYIDPDTESCFSVNCENCDTTVWTWLPRRCKASAEHQASICPTCMEWIPHYNIWMPRKADNLEVNFADPDSAIELTNRYRDKSMERSTNTKNATLEDCDEKHIWAWQILARISEIMSSQLKEIFNDTGSGGIGNIDDLEYGSGSFVKVVVIDDEMERAYIYNKTKHTPGAFIEDEDEE